MQKKKKKNKPMNNYFPPAKKKTLAETFEKRKKVRDWGWAKKAKRN